MKQKFIKLIAAICVCFCICGTVTALAADDFTVTVGTLDKTLNVVPGDEIVVPVYLTNNPGVYSYVFDFFYDVNTLTLDTDKTKTLLGRGDYACLVNDFTTNDTGGKFRTVTLASGSVDMANNGVAVYLFFTVKETAKGGFSDISVSYTSGNVVNYKGAKLHPKTVSGGVYIVAPEPQSDSSVAESENNSSGSDTLPKKDITPAADNNKVKGYVPKDILPDKAPEYYKEHAAEQQKTVDKIKNTASKQNESSIESSSDSDKTGDISSKEDSSDTSDKKENKTVNIPVIILIICGVVLLGATVVFLIKRDKEN